MPLRTRWIAAGLPGVFAMDACFEIGACPYEEEPAQLRRTPDFAGLNVLEIGCYAAALVAVHGLPPLGARFFRRDHSHDFGRYEMLAFRVDAGCDGGVAYARRIEPGLARWYHAGFTAPVTYDGGPRPTVHHATVEAAIGSAIMIMRPPYPDGAERIGHLRAYDPAMRSF